ncbi:BPI-like_protein [Hexamita inflata]|uniref:BPI-like protein n=1 Tax=Hexamita inflata TaxID=28002 RepID=A0AA86P6F2_9EUKA|nr:BPI-like protein [Hexamita inflata]
MFFYIVTHILNQQCDLPDYPHVLMEEDSALLLSMNNYGGQQYLQCAMKQSPKLLQRAQLPNIVLDVVIDGEQFEVDFQNISLLDITTNQTVVNLKSKSIYVMSFETHNTNILFNFSWTLKQMTYPFGTDNGTGEINITGSDLFVNGLSFTKDLDCLGNINYGISNVSFEPNFLNVTLAGGKSKLFAKIEEDLVVGLNELLLYVMGLHITEVIMKYFEILNDKQKNYQEYLKYPNIVKDDRFSSNVVAKLNQLVFMKSGYTFNLDNLSDQFIHAQMINALPVTRNNKQVEYTISKAALDNFLYIFHTYNDSYSNPSVFSVVEAPTMELSKNQVTLNLKVKIQDEEADLKLKGAPKLRTENDLTFLYFEFELEPEYYEVISWVNEQIKDACYLIKNEVFSLNGFSVVIDTDNDCVKIVGDIAACL